jgi:hypothetical protein
MKAIESELDRVRRRSTVKQSKLVETLLSLENDIDGVIKSLEVAEGLPQTDSTIPVNTIVRAQCEKIIAKKHLGAVKTLHKEHYTFLSKLGKNIDKAMNEDIEKVDFHVNDHPKEVLAVVKAFQEEREHESRSDVGLTPYVCALESIQKCVEVKEPERALEILQAKKDDLQHLEFSLVVSLHKLTFLSRLKAGQTKEAIAFLRSRYPKEQPGAIEDIGEMLHLATFRPKVDERPPKRLLKHDFDKLLSSTLHELRKKTRQARGLPESSPFNEIITAGLIALPEFVKHKEAFEDLQFNEKEVEVMVDLPPEFNHHSLIHCPIIKDYCKRGDALVLNCGHIVSRLSVKNVIDNTRGKLLEAVMFKCPTCPNSQRPSTLREIFY